MKEMRKRERGKREVRREKMEKEKEERRKEEGGKESKWGRCLITNPFSLSLTCTLDHAQQKRQKNDFLALCILR